MVPKKSHLPFEELRARGYREVATPYFLARARQNSSKKNRLGVVISASSAKNAARRNFWRRQIKSIFLEAQQKNFDLVVVLRPRATLITKHVFQKTLRDTIISLTSRL
jgi:ribonuclease P protein component